MENDVLLTIAVPTYNRSLYLEQLLDSLCYQLVGVQPKVELLIVDNNSPDNTAEVVRNHEDICDIRYIKNERNIGPDNNFIKCLTEAKGKYVLLFGDDDLFLEGSIQYLIDILSSGDYGVVHLKVLPFSDEEPVVDNAIRFESVNRKLGIKDFISSAHINTMFISANVINKQYFESSIPNVFLESNLVQLAWTFNAALKSQENFVVENKIVAGRLFNTSGYDFCKVFVKNVNSIVDYYVNKGFSRSIFDGMFQRLLMVYYPANIVKIRCGHYKVGFDSCHYLLWKYYNNSVYYWIFIVPALLLPKKVAWFIFSLVDKLRSK